MSPQLTRRELAQLAGVAALAAPFSRHAHAAPRARVGLAALPAEGLTPASARAALEKALVGATNATSAAAAVRALFKPTDTVGIKLNCLAGRGMSPRPELVEALATLLGNAGLARHRIIVFERSTRELRRAGFLPGDHDTYRCLAIDNDYDAEPSTSGSIGSCFARLASTTCTALVSFGVVKDHDLAGISAGAKNWYGIIHNPNKYHDSNCDPYLADLLRHPLVRDKVRLTILDGVTAQCHGGPAYRPDATWPLGVVAASTDLLAADAWAWRVIDAERTRRRPPRWLATAHQYGLGVGDPSQVEIVGA